MNKRIIAIICLAVLLVSVILAVIIVDNKKEIYVDEAGIEHWIYRNEVDHTVLNEYGDIVVYATDTNGKRQKDENGEYVTGAIEFPEMLIDGNTLETPDYRLTLSKEWKLSEDGVFTRKKNEDIKLFINEINVGDKELNEFYNDRLEASKKILEEHFKDQTQPIITSGVATITSKQLYCYTTELKQMSEDGSTVENYAFEIFYENNGKVFQISYSCENGSYDEAISVVEIIHASLTTKTTK